ncbi:putative reverse transcriptase Ty1/copia-type domain-containing protein [Phytophthora infestans]|uniref:Putative reverse transcriptase Ty1/copia-type domain-containing protein n=1 Tax=Phytophthora infestans TaxID=4787 RepID=A0A833SIT0_PHYIN|nr:putative reverse transcriptase Ty1/copia-type domain-containing protein [Phytophthora infestans]
MAALSSTEEEYIAMSSDVQECIGLNSVLDDLGFAEEAILVMEDNQGAQNLAESKSVTQRSRHISTKYNWLREKVGSHDVRVQYCRTNDMVADHFTKPLGRVKLKYFRDCLGGSIGYSASRW